MQGAKNKGQETKDKGQESETRAKGGSHCGGDNAKDKGGSHGVNGKYAGAKVKSKGYQIDQIPGKHHPGTRNKVKIQYQIWKAKSRIHSPCPLNEESDPLPTEATSIFTRGG